MHTYALLLRGINVGGKNKVPMAALKKCLEDLGFENVATYIASGNAIVDTKRSPTETKKLIEEALPKVFKLDDPLIKVLVLTHDQLRAIVNKKPKSFGEEPEKYASDAIFLIDVDSAAVMPIFSPREGVDLIWQGEGVVYSQRLSAERTKSRLSKITLSPLYKSLTIRTWNTAVKLLQMLDERKAAN